MSQLRVLNIEDDPFTAQLVAELLTAHGCDVTWVSTGADGLQSAAAETFDVIVLDRNLPGLSGVAITARLREMENHTPILMLSALGRSENRVEGLDAGVDDYLAKPFEPAELIARVRALHRRAHGQLQAPVLVLGELECHIKARTAHRRGKHIALSPKEFALFTYFMNNACEVVTREMLLRDVWNLSFDPQTNVIDVNVGRLRRKLEDGFAVPVLETIWGVGYRLTGG